MPDEDLSRPAFGRYPMVLKRREDRQDREAAKESPLAALRGVVAGTLGMPGDIEALARLVTPGVSNETALPTSEYFLDKLPLRVDTPTARAFGQAGTFAGSPGLIRMAASLPKAIAHGAGEFARASSPAYVIKPKGGNWLAGSVEEGVKPLRSPTAVMDPSANLTQLVANRIRGDYPELFAAYERDFQAAGKHSMHYGKDFWQWLRGSRPKEFAEITTGRTPSDSINNWLDQKLTKYIKNEMATPEDPVRALAEQGILHVDPRNLTYGRHTTHPTGEVFQKLGSSDLAKLWENAADYAIAPDEARTYLHTKHGETGVPTLTRNPWLAKVPPETTVYDLTYRGSDLSNLGFSHLVDELHNAINPTSGLPQHLLWKYQDLDKVTVPQAVERVHKINEWRAAQKAEADLAKAMNPATFLHKDYPEQGLKWVELRQPKDLPEGWTEKNGAYYDPRGERHVHPGVESLADALKYEGDTMGHCVGGYCPDVAAGHTRIYSLRDKKGQPHVTIEVRPTSQRIAPRHEEVLAEIKASGTDIGALSEPAYDAAYEQALQRIKQNRPPSQITQIKGKANLAPKDEYLPAIQDFVRSGEWSDVGDLQNTGLIDIQNPHGLLRALNKASSERLISKAMENFNAAVEANPNAQRYMTIDDLRNFLDGAASPEGFASGGAVTGANSPTGGLVEYNPALVGARVAELQEELYGR